MPSPRLIIALTLFVVASAPLAVRAADVLDNVPNDALGFVVINNIGDTNDKTERLLKSLQLQFPGPLALLNMSTGVGEGLDPHGNLLIAILPGARPTESPKFAIWLPAADYAQFVTSLNGTPDGAITAVTVAGEDLLVAKHGSWAVVLDPDQRDRLQALLTSDPAPPAKIAAWREWIESNNVSFILLPNGWHAMWVWAATDGAGSVATTPPTAEGTEQNADELFGVPTNVTDHDLGMADSDDGDFWSQLRAQLHQLRELPQLARWAAEADAIACGIRIDDDGNALAGIRIAVQSDWHVPVSRGPAANSEPPTLFQTGDYIVSGAARLQGPFVVAAAGNYARRIAEELKNEYHVAIEDEGAVRFQKALENAVTEVTAASVLTRPGEKLDGSYSNAYLAVRVADANVFAERFAEVVRLWNEMNKSDQDESQLVFEKEAGQVGGRAATVYSLDMVEAFGAAAVPEVRPSMERLFGPGGKLRLLVLTVDKHTVLLAIATEVQATPLVDVLSHDRPTKWDERTNRLLPQYAAWRVMINPQGHTRWLKRQMEAMLGTVIGAALVRQFQPSPPVGAAGGFKPHEIWADAAIPADTIRAAGQYLNQH